MHFIRFPVLLVSLLLSVPAFAQEPAVTDPAGPPAEQPAAAPAPALQEQGATAPTPQASARDVILVLDNSGSMKKNDPQSLAPVAVRDFIGRLDEGTRVGILAFDQDVRLLTGLTPVSDASRPAILENLRHIDYKGLFTNSPAAMERAIYELKNSGRADAQKLIVFMTDGIVDTGNAAVDLDRARWLREDLAPDAADAGIRIFSIAFTEDADFQLIQSLAQNTGGEYFRALDAAALNGVFENINAIIDRPPEPEPIAAPEPEPAPVVAPPPPQQPIVIEVPAAGSESMQREERIRSIIILVAAVVLIGALIAVIVLLVRRGREDLKAASDQYVAEAYLNDIHGVTGQPSYKLGSRAVMLGRVAGKDSTHLDYLVIPQSTIGRRHALIEYKDYGYWISDQGSINGTFVNDRPVTSEVRLKHGDRVRLHRCEFEFVMPEVGDAGMTVVSHTTYANAPAPQAEEAVFDLSSPDLSSEPAEEEEDTVLRGGGGAAPSRPAAPADDDDETLLPGSDARKPAVDQGETLVPGFGSAPDADDSEDETLLPGGGAARKAADDEFFDITGTDEPRKK